jgi:hypothetical protein
MTQIARVSFPTRSASVSFPTTTAKVSFPMRECATVFPGLQRRVSFPALTPTGEALYPWLGLYPNPELYPLGLIPPPIKVVF